MSETADNERFDAQDAKQHERLTVVGIGASAGGLAGLQRFFDAVGADTGMAFVVVTHMDPERESLLPEILQKHTKMPVRQVNGLVPIEANHVYVISPNVRILITDTHLDTENFEEPRGRRTPIDYFFRSLANVHREAVAIILSGGGTDGAVGVKAIKEQGGLLLVQDPAEAEHDSMPRAAIATGLADLVLPAAELAQKLVEYHVNGVRLPKDPEALTPEEQEAIYRILTQVQVQTGHDFSQYKRSTLLRRIRRRMQLNGHQTLDAYLSRLRHDAPEAEALFGDLLIGVTNFFRDKESWEALAEQVIPRLFEGKGPGDTVRVWSIGCATGEEAYSLAILLLEHTDTLNRPTAARPGLQVFASDLNADALQKAREGLYPEAIEADVGAERLARWFVKEGHYYRVKQELRDIVLYSNHSVLRDPPFSRLDLISCRNLLIYLNRELQENVFEIFHYALNAQGYLFLGTAESAEMIHGLFETLDKRHRLYQARLGRSEQTRIPSLPLTIARPERRGGQMPARAARPPVSGKAMAEFHVGLLEENAPASVLVDEQHRILHMSKTAGRYLLHTHGTVTDDLLRLVRPELQFELRAVLFQAFAEQKMVLGRSIFVQFNGTPRRVIVAVRPAAAESETPSPLGTSETAALVFFLEDETAAGDEQMPTADTAQEEAGRADAALRDPLLTRLEAENQRLEQRLQTTTEEYESSTEELKAANEELQSVNEELQTVNSELKNKLEEVSRAHSDLENLMSATDIATLFLDWDLRIQRYTPGTAELFNIMLGDRGRPIDHLTNRLQYDGLAQDARRVLKTLESVEREVQDVTGRWLLVRVRPYRTVDNRIDGVVLTFVDVTPLKETEAALRQEKEYSEKIVDTVREGMLVLKPDLTVEFANDSFFTVFGVDRAETVGRRIYDLGNGQWNIPELRTLLEEILPAANSFNDYRVEHDFEAIGQRIMLLNARRLDHVERILLAIEDITERERYERELRASEERYRALLTSTSDVVYRMSPDWREMHQLHGRGFLTNTEAPSADWLEEYVPAEDRARVTAAFEAAIENKSVFELEHRVRRADGSVGWILSRAVPLLDAGGAIVEWIGAASDITERKVTEQLLEEHVEQRTREVRELAAQLTTAEHEERARVAQILHDDLQQQLYALQMQLVLLRSEAGDEALVEEFARMEAAAGAAIRTARQLSVDLSPPVLEGEGLAEALRWLTGQMQEQYQLDINLEADASFPAPSRELRVLLFQMTRELLFNVVKHAGVAEARVKLLVVHDPEIGAAYRIDVHDEGVGFDTAAVFGPEALPDGRGLVYMRKRLRLIGGRLDVVSVPGDGVRASILAPLEQETADGRASAEEEE